MCLEVTQEKDYSTYIQVVVFSNFWKRRGNKKKKKTLTVGQVSITGKYWKESRVFDCLIVLPTFSLSGKVRYRKKNKLFDSN